MPCRLSLCLLVAALALPVRAVQAQSLADVSKKEEERRKTIKVPSKVYTNDDLKSVPPPSSAPVEDSPAMTEAADSEAAESGAAAGEPAGDAAKPAAGDAAADADAPAAPAAGGKDQAYWSGRAKELQTQLERDKTFADALQSRINALITDFENRSDPAQRAVVEQDRNKAIADLERVKQAIQNDEKAIADFQEEARRAGVPPGWLR